MILIEKQKDGKKLKQLATTLEDYGMNRKVRENTLWYGWGSILMDAKLNNIATILDILRYELDIRRKD